MLKLKVALICAVVGMVWAGTALAFFSNEEAAPPAAKPAFDLSGSTNVVTQIGFGVPIPVMGFGNDLPLADSMDMILPESWTYSVTDDCDMSDKKATWEAHGTWIDVLEKLGANENLRFLVDWKNNQVIVTQGDPEQAVNVAELLESQMEEKQSEEALVLAEQEAQAEIELQPAPEPLWELKPGSLKNQLKAWAVQATDLEPQTEWQIVWAAPTDFQLHAKAEIQGEFTEAVSQVIQSIHTNGAPLRAYIYKGNGVVLVKGE
jgi:hypothetical protein